MADEGKFPKILDDRMRAFFENAAKFIGQMKANGSDPCHAITPDSPEWMDWLDYFHRHVGSVPVTMRMVEEGQVSSFTAPAKQPEWFDPRYVPMHPPPRRSAIPSPRPDPTPAERQRVMAMVDQFRAEMGRSTNSMRNPKPLPREPIRPERSTDAA
jgi:hypothetical protein